MMYIFRMMSVYLSKHRYRVLLYTMICLCTSSLSLIIPYLTGDFLDVLMISDTYESIYKYCSYLICFFCANTIMKYISSLLYINLQMNIGYQFNRDVINHIYKVDTLIADNFDSTYISQKINNDTNELSIFVLTFLTNVFINIFLFLISLVVLLQIHNFMAIIVLVASLIYALLYVGTKKIIYTTNKMVKESQSIYFSKLNEQLRYVRFIKLHNAYGWFAKRLDEAYEKLFGSFVKNKKVNLIISSANGMVLTTIKIFIFGTGGKAVIDGNMSVGQFTICMSYFNIMVSSLQYFTGLGKAIQESRVSYNRIKDILDIPTCNNGTIMVDNVTSIVLDRISFRYGNDLIFDGCSLKFDRGNIYVLIGRNGSGKSTLLNIIAGMYSGDFSTSIYINGMKMDELDLHYYRENLLAISEQESTLISDTFLNNLYLGNAESSVDYNLLEQFLKEFGLNSIFENKSNHEKYELIVNDKNSNLSGGEKQKIAIIRTLIKDCDLMMFDEPTSALDQKSKEYFWSYINAIKKDKIIIIISHDNYITQNADIIYDVDILNENL